MQGGLTGILSAQAWFQVLVAPDPELMGKMVNVKIESAGKHHLMGVVSDSQVTCTNKLELATPKSTEKSTSKHNPTKLWSAHVSIDVFLIVLLLFVLFFVSVYKLELHKGLIRTFITLV